MRIFLTICLFITMLFTFLYMRSLQNDKIINLELKVLQQQNYIDELESRNVYEFVPSIPDFKK